ncbi:MULTISPECIES: hypothetical protein [unclassified Streptomyces]|uniref:hypothetical protein n=1 Tax=unclassified Streptomyces TaxID=2593676 RepID=UPI002DDAD75C|nr:MULTISPECIES: hypothetical protein [unclassified Streptomyces]WSA92885.1 hypothetical protein OIE63_15895 [Streptomyces sp. NBC_01795]WSB77254.1 hypothetical protein OHB04_16730 [Streptomyces sp. NBC_01775]WSS14481.1 hypothetical protein OG533_23240 [Streptomyces sp. NBC_01186]WSS43298.1 hypothetical protein OG220_23920 [Streptomyces sp. NBC_01187]
MIKHPFEPSRLLLGLAMLAVAAVYLMDAAGVWEVPFWVPLAVLPAALLLAGCTALVTFTARRRAHRREQRG